MLIDIIFISKFSHFLAILSKQKKSPFGKFLLGRWGLGWFLGFGAFCLGQRPAGTHKGHAQGCGDQKKDQEAGQHVSQRPGEINNGNDDADDQRPEVFLKQSPDGFPEQPAGQDAAADDGHQKHNLFKERFCHS